MTIIETTFSQRVYKDGSQGTKHVSMINWTMNFELLDGTVVIHSMQTCCHCVGHFFAWRQAGRFQIKQTKSSILKNLPQSQPVLKHSVYVSVLQHLSGSDSSSHSQRLCYLVLEMGWIAVPMWDWSATPHRESLGLSYKTAKTSTNFSWNHGFCSVLTIVEELVL